MPHAAQPPSTPADPGGAGGRRQAKTNAGSGAEHNATKDGGHARCPFCGSSDTELVSLFGSQLMTGQHRCRACRTYFEAVRDDARGD